MGAPTGLALMSPFVSSSLHPLPGRRAPSIPQEGLDDGPDFLSEEDGGLKAIHVDLQSDAALQVDISDALSERDKVKFTVHTKVNVILYLYCSYLLC